MSFQILSTSRPVLLLALVFAALWASSAHAADDQNTSKWGLGLAAATQRSPYNGIDQTTVGLPLISYENKYVKVFGNTLDYKLPSAGEFDFTLRAKYALGEGYKASDSAFLSGMADRNGGLYLGATATWNNPAAKLSVGWLSDASNESKGSQLSLAVEHAFHVGGQFEITPHLGVTVLDAKYVDYYYGVSAAETTPTRHAYVGEATTNTEVGVRLGYAIDAQQRVFLDLTNTWWGAGITDSPLVNKTSAPGVRVAYLYLF